MVQTGRRMPKARSDVSAASPSLVQPLSTAFLSATSAMPLETALRVLRPRRDMGRGGDVGRPEARGERPTRGERGHEGADEGVARAVGADERDGERRKDHGALAPP